MKKFTILMLVLLAVGCRFTVRPQEQDTKVKQQVCLGMDILYLNKGEEIPGRLEKIKKDGTFVFTDQNKKTTEYSPKQVLRVEFQRKRPGDEKCLASQLNDPVVNEALKKDITGKKYPNAAYVTIYDQTKVEIAKDLSYIVTRRSIRKVLTRQGLGIANQYVDYLSDSAEAELIFARTISPEGNLFHVSENAIEDGSRFGAYPQYDNARRLKWSMREVNEGSYVDYSYSVKHKPAQTLRPLYEKHYFQSSQPIIYSEFVVKAAADVDIVVEGINTEDNFMINKMEEFSPSGKFFKMTSANMPRIEPENMMPPWPDVLPWAAVSLEDTWKQISEDYGKNLEKILSEGIHTASQKADELISETNDTEQKARKIYNYIAREIGFLDIPADEYGFLPHRPAEILSAGQANALDKAFLLHAMLKSTGIESSLLLAHRRDSGMLPEKIACITQMNTPVVEVVINDSAYYCFPTTQLVPFGHLPSGLQGSEALEAGNSKDVLTGLPLSEASEESVLGESSMELFADGRIHVRRRLKILGGYQLVWREWSKLKPEEITQKFERIAADIHPNAKLLDYSPKTPEAFGQLGDILEIEYEYEIADYALNAGGEILVFQVPEIDYDATAIEKYERNLPMFWGSRYSIKNDIKIITPEGYEIKTAKELRSYEGEEKPFMWYSGSFRLRTEGGSIKNEIHFVDSFIRTGVYELPEKYDIFINTIKTRARIAKELVVLEKSATNDK